MTRSLAGDRAGDVAATAPWLEARRKEVDTALAASLGEATWPPAVRVPMQYSIAAGGKRLRPLLALAAAETVAPAAVPALTPAEARALAMPIACALEFIHTYSLVHDDLPAMDDDVLRRGQPTVHVQFGEGPAILAGDALLTEAFGLIARGALAADRDGTIVRRAIVATARLARAAGAEGMVGGQAIDLELTGQSGTGGKPSRPSVQGWDTEKPSRPRVLELDTLRDMHARKTGALIRAAAACGAIMAGAPDPVIDAVDTFAAHLGLAFQIVDDILDVEGTDAALGKTAGKDAAAGKLTYPALVGLERSRELAAEAVAHADAALDAIGTPAPYLRGIADWVLRRSS